MTDLSYVYVFLQSNLLEVPIYLLFYLLLFKKNMSWLKMVGIISLCNLMTHPIVFFVIMPLKLNYLTNILIAESFAVLGEAALHRWCLRLPLTQTLTSSLVANLFSWQVAPLLTYLVFY